MTQILLTFFLRQNSNKNLSCESGKSSDTQDIKQYLLCPYGGLRMNVGSIQPRTFPNESDSQRNNFQ